MHAEHRLRPPVGNNTEWAAEPNRGYAERRLARSAAATSLVLGLGFGLPCAYGLWYFATRNEVWIFLGFPTYGDGPFDGAGIPTMVPLLAGFLIICILEIAAAVLLWLPHRAGYWISLLLLPLEAIYWIGFALPFGPLLGALRTGLVLAAVSVNSRAHANRVQGTRRRRPESASPRSSMIGRRVHRRTR